MDWVIQIGLVELVLGALLGWAMVVCQESPELLRRIGIVAPQRVCVSGGLVAAAIVGPG